MSFIDEYCTGFDDEDEHKLEFTKIHNVSDRPSFRFVTWPEWPIYVLICVQDFKKIVEDLLQELMAELGVSDT